METDPRTRFKLKIGSFLPSPPLPAHSLDFYSFLVIFHSLLRALECMYITSNSWLHAWAVAKGVTLSAVNVNLKEKKNPRRPRKSENASAHRALSVQVLKFTFSISPNSDDFQESTSSRSGVWLNGRHKAQMQRKKSRVTQGQICLKMYLLTASWQDCLFPILSKQSQSDRLPFPDPETHTCSSTWQPERMLTGLAERWSARQTRQA